MNIEMRTTPLTIDIFGFGGTATNKDYAGTAFRLSGRMWEIVKANSIKNQGKNMWVYEEDDQVFAGVEVTEEPPFELGLERKSLTLARYAYYKHIGSFQLLKHVGQSMRKELEARNVATKLPYIEIYGHWNSDESKCETELLMSVK